MSAASYISNESVFVIRCIRHACYMNHVLADKMKDATVAKIAMQCSSYYAEALKLLQLYSVSSVWPKVWSVSLSYISAYI